MNQAIEDGWSYNAIKDVFPNPPAKATFFKHKAHVTSALVTDAEQARKNPVITPKSNKEVLEAIRDIGLRNAMENPDSITANHAIRAAAILSEKETKRDPITVILAKLVQQNAEPPMLETVIEGEYSTDG